MEDCGEFFFESEHIALKNNADYHKLVKCIVVLEAQRAQAIKDIDTIKLSEKEALKDTTAFVEKLKNGQSLGVPGRQIVSEIPKIDWLQYSKFLPPGLEIPVEKVTANKTLEDSCLEQNMLTVEEPTVLSGDVDKKPVTYNRLWSVEEQKRLEELLVEYPSEPIEMRRFAKIAKALGNRTTKQVCSRVQKYFIKLHRAGLPIPGRIPKTIERKGPNHKHQRYNHYLYRPSTFFPENDVPVHMSEFDDDVPGPSSDTYGLKMESKHSELSRSVRNSPLSTDTYKKITLLRKVKEDKQKGKPFCIHTGFSCQECGENPIVGVRWHCSDCSMVKVNFCADCVISQLDSPRPHPLSHNLVPIRQVTTQLTNKILSNEDQMNQRNYLIANSFSDTVVKTEPAIESTDTTDCFAGNELGSSLDNAVDSLRSVSVYDEDYFPQSFGDFKDNQYYNYLDPNLLPE